jgi:hypothetical protein
LESGKQVIFYGVPTHTEKTSGEAIRPGCFVRRHVIYGTLELLHGEREVKVRKVQGGK